MTAHGDRLAGQAELGGVWEWTSSALARHEGFEPMELYPAYTGESLWPVLGFKPVGRIGLVDNDNLADFFDGKHNVILGGSWATHPRIAGRKSL